MKKLINIYVVISILLIIGNSNEIYSQNITVNFDYIGGVQSPNGALGGLQYENIPYWITISNINTGYGYYRTEITCAPNAELVRSSVVSFKNFDNSINGTYIIKQSQIPCLLTWYPDSDGDGFGNPYESPIFSCIDPYNGSGVNNNFDNCPDFYSTINSGCEQGYVYENMNWILSKSFDITGATIASSKSYFDELGKGIQTQSVDIKTGHTWASQTMYDAQGRPALNSLSAPINNTGEFLYNPNFIKKPNGMSYTTADYETNIENPEAIGNIANTLGWYYSENNTNEPYQDITLYPFSRTIYSELNPGTARKVIGGNKIDINGDGVGDIWKSGYTFSMPAGQELSKLSAFNDLKYNDIKTVKTVSRDVHGVEIVVFTDTDGKTLATARSGSEDALQNNSHSIIINEQGFVDIHIPVGITGFTVVIPVGITTEVYDLITEQITTIPTANLTKGFYRIAITNLDLYNAVNDPVTISYSENYYDYSLNEYDKAGRLIASYQPYGTTKATKPVSTFTYNVLGQLVSTTSPDEGTANFKYRKDGQIRFSQNSKQKDPDGNNDFSDAEFSYTNYDDLGRPIESGVSVNIGLNFDSLDPDSSNNLSDTGETEQHFTVYDSQDIPLRLTEELPTKTFNQALTDLGLTTIEKLKYQPTFLAGNVAITYTKNPETTTTWYSYDIYGRVTWIVQNINGLGTKTIDYEYDPITSAVTKVDFQRYKADERFVHKYTYNVVGELIKVETSTDDTTFITHADYQYNETGALKRVEIAEGLQSMDYVYNLAGQLKAINQPELDMVPSGDANDLFGMQLNYFEGDYLRSGTNITSPSEGINQYNGNIKSVRWNTSGLGPVTPDSYYYKYNKNNWLEGASFNNPLVGASEGTNITNFSQGWDWRDFLLGTPLGGGGGGSLSSTNNTVTFSHSSGFSDSYLKTGQVIQINYPVPDMELGYISVTRSTGEIITDQFKVSIANGWIVVNAVNPYYHSLQYKNMGALDNSVTIPVSQVADDQISATGDYNVFDITYDANGNIQTLNRNKNMESASNAMDKLTYKYDANKPNQLNHVIDTEGNVGVEDIGSQRINNYKYNSIGQLIEDWENVTESEWNTYIGSGLTPTNIIKYFYNASGLVTEVQKNNIPLVKFFYNDKGQRVRKEGFDLGGNSIKNEYYVRDAAGSVLAIYEGNAQKELPIYGASRLGVFFKASNSSVYQLTDHLGNVRAVIAKDGNNAVATTATDYYPFGMPMPGRNLVGDYRYKFQGQEKDPETGKEAFQLRLWDSRIGRWLTTDPAGQYNSPYVGMGNDPINGIDPDGGYKTWFGAALGWIGGGFQGKISHPGGDGYKDWSVFRSKNLGGGDGNQLLDEIYLFHDFGLGINNKYQGDNYSYSNQLSNINLVAGMTVGNLNTFTKGLVDSKKMVNFKLDSYNLYRSNGALNGNQHISGSKFLGRVKAIKTVANYASALNVIGVADGYAQSYFQKDQRYLVRGTVSYLVGNIPYLGAAYAHGVDNSSLKYYHLSHYIPGLYNNPFNQNSLVQGLLKH